jgi:hypothetical protein
MSRLTKIEQETVINFNAGEEEAVVYTRDKAVIRKLDSLVTEFPNVYRCLKATDIDKTYSMPKQYVGYRKPRRITQARRDQVRAQMRRLNEKYDKHGNKK